MPSRLIHDENGMGIGCDGQRYFGKVQAHGLGVAVRQDKSGALALTGTDCTEDVG